MGSQPFGPVRERQRHHSLWPRPKTCSSGRFCGIEGHSSRTPRMLVAPVAVVGRAADSCFIPLLCRAGPMI